MNFSPMGAFAQAAAVQPIAPEDAVARASKGEVVLVDVREHNELAMSGKAQGAVHIPMMQLQMQADPRSPEKHEALSTEKPVVLYCASGGRAYGAAQALLAMGYKEVYNLGGLMHWQVGGGAVEAA